MKKTEPIQLRVLSYNIHKGFSSWNRKFVLEHIREAIRSVNANLVFLQEVVGQNSEHAKNIESWPQQAQFEYVADRLWTHFAYGRNAIYQSGHHGNAILSMYPFSSWENIDISMMRLEDRGLLHGVIEIPRYRAPLHVICLHFGLFEALRRKQLRELCKRLESAVPDGEPVVVAGDFNDWRERASDFLREEAGLEEVFIRSVGTHARTYPSWLPVLKLDRIYVRGLTIQSAQCFSGEPWNSLSDHAALFADLRLG